MRVYSVDYDGYGLEGTVGMYLNLGAAIHDTLLEIQQESELTVQYGIDTEVKRILQVCKYPKSQQYVVRMRTQPDEFKPIFFYITIESHDINTKKMEYEGKPSAESLVIPYDGIPIDTGIPLTGVFLHKALD